jgi:hypothetical protein
VLAFGYPLVHNEATSVTINGRSAPRQACAVMQRGGAMQRFPALSTISMLLKVLAVLVLIIGLIAGLVASGWEIRLPIWIGAAIQALLLWAFAEMIAVALAIEKNTWATHQALITHPRQPQSTAPSVAPQPAGSIPSSPQGPPTVPKPGERPFKGLADDIERRQIAY